MPSFAVKYSLFRHTVQKTVESYRKGSTPTAESKPAAKSFTPGRPKVLNGKTYVEVSPNNWQPQ